jgi:transcriptional regulator with XRE-family HTH domain
MSLRDLRTANGLTVEDVAKELLCSPTKINHAETGARRATLRDVPDLLQIEDYARAIITGIARRPTRASQVSR